MYSQHDPALLFPFATTSTGGILCWGYFLLQTRFPFLTPPFQPPASPALASLLPLVLECFNHPCVGKDGED